METNIIQRNMTASGKHWLVVAVMLLFAAMSASAAKEIKVALKRGEAAPAVGQPMYLTVIMNDINGELPRLNVPGAKMLYMTNTETRNSEVMINGRKHSASSYRAYVVTLRPEKEGKLTIPSFTVDGVKSNALTVNVGKASATTQSGNSASNSNSSSYPDAGQTGSASQSGPRYIGRGNDNLFMIASVSKTTAYEQEALVYTVKLYSSFSSIRFIGATESPKFDGFTLEESNPKTESLHFESYKGKQYACAVIARYIIFPQMKGKLTIKGNKYTVTAESRPEYWDPFWGRISYGVPVQLSVQPNDLTIDVKALPQPQPANFSGGVGHFRISASMPNKKLATNQAASVVYTVTGTGNIKYITLPDLSLVFPKQFEVSTPTPEITAAPNGATVSGTVKFDCSIMPVEEGDYELPAVELVYFNPETGKYETAKSQSFKVTVGKGKTSGTSTGNVIKFDEDLITDIYPLSRKHSFWSGGRWYWLSYAIFFVVGSAILSVCIIHRRRNADAEGMMARRARRMADRLLRHARRSLKANDRDKFFDQVLTALWGYAAHKMRMPGSEMQRQLVEANFAEHNVPQETIDRFIGLLNECEEAKYARAGIDMKKVYENAADTIRLIDTSFTK